MIERRRIPLDELIVDTAQSRQEGWVGDEQDLSLANSLEHDGLLQSLLVRPVEMTGYDDVEEDYAIVAGSRRYHAAIQAGFDSVHCRIIEADDFEAAEKSLKENEERKGLSDQERASSLYLQFKLKEPDEEQCPDCGQVFDGLNGLNAHQTTECQISRIKDGALSPSFEPANTFELKHYLAQSHFPEVKHRLKALDQYLRIAELPDDLQSLWKAKEERTEQERETLSNFDIDRELSAERGDYTTDLGESVLSLHKTVEETTDGDTIDSTNAVLETMGRLSFNEQSNSDLIDELTLFKTEVNGQLAGLDDVDEQRQVFNSTLEEHESQIHELREELADPSLSQLKFRFNSLADGDDLTVNQYRRYHARAKQQLKTQNNAEVVRYAYRTFLKEQAKKNGWG